MVMFEPDSGGQRSADMWGHIVDEILNERSKFPPSPMIGGQLKDEDFETARAELLYKDSILYHTHKAYECPPLAKKSI